MLFKRELKRNLKSFIVAVTICSVLVMYIISMAPSFGSDIQQILNMKLPKQMQTAMGLIGLNYNDPISFYCVVFSYVYLFFSIYVAGTFATIVSKEYSDKTAEFLFSLPAKRLQIIWTKLNVAFLYTALSVVIIFLVSLLSFVLFIKDSYDLTPVLMMSLAWLIGGLTFGSMAFLVSSFLIKSRAAATTSVGIILIMYMLQVVISLNEKLDFLKYISPFDWFKGPEIASSGGLSVTYCLIALFFILTFFITGIRRFNKMDVLI
jgi:ABC-2 type transport system permease protein